MGLKARKHIYQHVLAWVPGLEGISVFCASLDVEAMMRQVIVAVQVTIAGQRSGEETTCINTEAQTLLKGLRHFIPLNPMLWLNGLACMQLSCADPRWPCCV